MNRVLVAAKVPAMTLGSATGMWYGLATGLWPVTALGCLLVPVAAWHAAGHAKWALIGVTLFITGLVLRIAPAMPLHSWWLLFVTLGIVDVAGTAVWWHHHRTSTAGTISKWDRQSRRNGGVASPLAVLRTGWHVRSQATTLRPSLKGLSWWRLQRVPLAELGFPLARVWMFRVWASFRDCILYLGGTGAGKSGTLAAVVLSAPKDGAVLVASRRLDLMANTAALRSENGKPVGVYNPGGLGGITSTVTFDPLMGCENPATALKQAQALLAGTKTATAKDGAAWNDQGSRLFAPFLHAAAISGATMGHVNSWVTNPVGAYDTVMGILSHSPQHSFTDDFQEYVTMGNPGSSVKMTIRAALSWAVSEAAMASIQPSDFDVESFLDGGTIYLLGDNDDTVAPLVTAFTMHIAREAERIATLRGGRLDPPFTMVLDEVVNCCPVPLVEWTAYFAGMGVLLHIAAQSLAQLREKYGDNGVDNIRTCINAILVFRGTKNPVDLQSHVQLLGRRQEVLTAYAGTTKTAVMSTPAWVPVMSEDQVMRIPPFSAAILSDRMPTAIGRCQMVWERADYQRAHRAARRAGVPSLTARLRSLSRRFGPTPAVEPPRQPIAALPLGFTEQAKRDRAACEAMEAQVAVRGPQRRDVS